jgi:hypothetical protein
MQLTQSSPRTLIYTSCDHVMVTLFCPRSTRIPTTDVSAQYVTLWLLEHILLYLYAAVLTMVPPREPKWAFPLLQSKYENLNEATSNWLICGSCTNKNTMHSKSLTRAPHKTDHRKLASFFPFYHSTVSIVNTSMQPLEFQSHTSTRQAVVKDVFPISKWQAYLR